MRTLSEILIDAEKAETLNILTKLEWELISNKRKYPLAQVEFGVEYFKEIFEKKALKPKGLTEYDFRLVGPKCTELFETSSRTDISAEQIVMRGTQKILENLYNDVKPKKENKLKQFISSIFKKIKLWHRKKQ